MKQYIYADNAATTKLDTEAFEAMKPYLLNEYANASQPYSFSRSAKAAINNARSIIASCINADPEEIYFTSGGTESDNWAIKGSAFSDVEKRATITSAFEHHAVLRSCEMVKRLGYPVAYIPPSSDGVISPESLEQYISDKTHLVSVMFANNEIGSIQPIKELCDITHNYGALFHTDAVQAIGHINIDVKKLGIDMMSGSAHKFNGPKGIGFLYIRKGVNIVSFNSGGSQEFGLRAGTENVAAIVGMAIALKKNVSAIESTSSQLLGLEKLLIQELNGLDFIRNGAPCHIPGIISLSFNGCDGETIMHRMDLKGICISTGAACDSVHTQLSHVIKKIGIPENYAKGTIRISLGKYNTREDVLNISKSLAEIVNF